MILIARQREPLGARPKRRSKQIWLVSLAPASGLVHKARLFVERSVSLVYFNSRALNSSSPDVGESRSGKHGGPMGRDGAMRRAPRPSRRVVSHNRQAKALNLRSRRCAPAPGCLGRVALGPRLLGRLRAPLRRRFAFARSGRARPALAAFATSDIFD